MASKNLPTLLRNAKQKGVENGLITMQNVCLIALDNIAEDYMPEEKVGEFLRETEAEMQRVWSEILKSVGTELDLNRTKMNDENSYTVAEWLLGWVTRIRQKRGMDG